MMAPVAERNPLSYQAVSMADSTQPEFNFQEKLYSNHFEKELTNPSCAARCQRFRAIRIVALTLCVLAVVCTFLNFPSGIYDGICGTSKPNPSTQSIEQQVNRILTHTPLIGMDIYLLRQFSCQSLT